jgi:2-oxoglutarate dehydrogenase complex dehydrogenase (E1) component-like enzyme
MISVCQFYYEVTILLPDCGRVIPEEGAAIENPSGVKKLLFCSGKVYYDLKKARSEKNLDRDVAIARVEQVQFVILHCSIVNICSFVPH